MGIEIERKFLVNSKLILPMEYSSISQGYISHDNIKNVRVRTRDDKGFITVKSKVSDITNTEYEYEIPHKDAIEMLFTVCDKRIVKRRHIINYSKNHLGHPYWEVDLFSNGLIIAEIELPSEDFDLVLPDWIEREVTGDFEYSNLSMCLNGLKGK